MVWWLSGRFGVLRPEGCRFELRSGRNVHVGTFSKFPSYDALHYNCICAAEACKGTSELGILHEEGERYQRSLVYCIVLYCIVIEPILFLLTVGKLQKMLAFKAFASLQEKVC